MSTASPFYQDWTFWAFVSSLIAIGLSQAPPVVRWFSKPRLILELPNQLRITHVAGYASAGVVLSIRNAGGKPARVTSLSIKFRRGGVDLLEAPILEFHPDPRQAQTLLVMPLTVAPGAEVTRSMNAYQHISRERDRDLGQLASKVRVDIGRKAEVAQAKSIKEHAPQELVTLDPILLQAAQAMYAANFCWTAGDYDIQIICKSDEQAEVRQERLVFTLWESDEAELRSLADDYQHGFGIGVPSERHGKGVFVTLRKI
ncbi:hypothetical protein ACSFA7_13760 [Variovorax sp. LT1R20]|uniref:hypothetical protein n=1 Tax=Variovorax sp. LT1R20 TaxID=3443729 RepID=UPI003F4535BA